MAFIGNIVTNWATTALQGAATAAVSYGGGLAGDVVSGAGNVIESTGRGVGGKVEGYAKNYGDWINSYGDSLRGVKSVLPRGGPLSVYADGKNGTQAKANKAITAGPNATRKTLPRTNSSPASTAAGSKAMVKTNGAGGTANKSQKSGPVGGVQKPVTRSATSAVNKSVGSLSDSKPKAYPSTVTNRGAGAANGVKKQASGAASGAKGYPSTVTNKGAGAVKSVGSTASGAGNTAKGYTSKVTGMPARGAGGAVNGAKGYSSKVTGMPGQAAKSVTNTASSYTPAGNSYKSSGNSYAGHIPGFGGESKPSAPKSVAGAVPGGGHIPGF
ncbi:hypothetical protein K402DRAFT_389637 [Aulographum hederae CBS 113979]|uniref:Uncharacterized protein n=1 Tax=Aulographum hederae CBS 113979 TaxID=1176131 RepID=A0A6G1HC31_9PEZI|nr:hypothetical protein K402DRAFT_389637 [Aulographum hederae CBS 113979]